MIAEPVLDADDRLPRRTRRLPGHLLPALDRVAPAATRDQSGPDRTGVGRARRLRRCSCSTPSCPRPAPRSTRRGFQVAGALPDPPRSRIWSAATGRYAVVLPNKRVLLCVRRHRGTRHRAATPAMVGAAQRHARPRRHRRTFGPGTSVLANIVATPSPNRSPRPRCCGRAVRPRRPAVLRWARAGHLPPVLVRGQEATTLPVIRGLLLGALAEAEASEEEELQLEPEDTLLHVTDGLVERRDTAVQGVADPAARRGPGPRLLARTAPGPAAVA
ncbi:serine/threonine-protein phosphatase [Streptomyces tricolor]|nr:serine/threonine-protein phosphatase [Streptomyces tricolor]